MAASAKAKAKRLETLRERRRVKHEQTGDTPEAAAAPRKQIKAYDEYAAKKRFGRGVIFS